MPIPSNPPCLYIVFNRPRKVVQTIESLMQAGPSKVYIHGDGPRQGNSDDSAKIEEVWQIIEAADWPCQIVTKRRQSNAGLGNGVSAAIDWFFEQEDAGIILEDDVAIEPTSLQLAAQMLEYGREKKEIGSISLFNAVPREFISEPNATFRSSIYVSSLYWGTWADRWSELDRTFDTWEESLSVERLRELGGRAFARYWTGFFNRMKKEPVDTWDYAWLARNWSLGRRTLFTNSNFMVHVGFDSEGTHSHEAPRWFPMTRDHWDGDFRPSEVHSPDKLADAWSSRNQVGVGMRKAFKRLIAKHLPWVHSVHRRMHQRNSDHSQ